MAMSLHIRSDYIYSSTNKIQVHAAENVSHYHLLTNNWLHHGTSGCNIWLPHLSPTSYQISCQSSQTSTLHDVCLEETFQTSWMAIRDDHVNKTSKKPKAELVSIFCRNTVYIDLLPLWHSISSSFTELTFAQSMDFIAFLTMFSEDSIIPFF